MANESRSKYLIKNTSFFALGSLGTKLINFIMVPLYTYVLSTHEYGMIDTIIGICSIIIPLIMCNIGEAVRRFLLDKDSDDDCIQTVQMVWLLIGTIISVFIYFILSHIPDFKEYSIEMSLYILGNAYVLTVLEFLRGKEKLGAYTICSLLQTFMVAALNILFLVKYHMGIHGYFLSYIISYFCCGGLAFLWGKQHYFIRNLKFNMKLFVDMSKFSIMLVPNSIMWWITNSSDKIMITYLISASANGIYSISSKLPTILSTLNTILLQAWQYSAIREADSKDKIEYNNKMFNLYMTSTCIVGAFLLFINRPFINIYVATEYRVAWKYAPFLITSSMVATLNTFVGTSYYVQKDMKGNLKSATVGAIVNICLNIILIPTIGIMGASIATCVSFIAVLLYRVKDTKKYLPIYMFTPYSCILFTIMAYMIGVSHIPGLIGEMLLLLGVILVLFVTRNNYISIIKKLLKRRN